MVAMLLETASTEQVPIEFLRAQGELFAVFDRATQDSGNVSYGVRVDGERFFVKTAGVPADPEPALSHPERIAQLRKAVQIARTTVHPALPALRNVIESPEGPLLVYDWVEGELLGTERARRGDPTSAHFRFRALPAGEILAALHVVFDVHERLAVAGWIAVDFYDGGLIYDFARRVLHLIDLDLYRLGAFTNTMGRMFGSTRFMAPEEFQLGARIDQRTNVFTLGRCLLEFLGNGRDDAGAFRAMPALLPVARRACQPQPQDRFAGVAEFCAAVRAASGG